MYGSYHNDNIFATFLYIGFGSIWLLCFYRIVRKECQTTSPKRKVTNYWMSILCVLTLVPIIFVYLHYQQKLSVPTLLKAQRHGVYADFKTDGTYIIKSGAWASKTHFYGKYNLHDSIIQIDTGFLDKVLTSNRFLIKHTNLTEEKHRPDYDRLNTEKYLVQIDKEGNELKVRQVNGELLSYKFEVVIDNMK